MKDFWKELRGVEQNICSEINYLIKKLGGISTEDDKFEFFNFSTIGELDITEIDADGKVVGGYQNDIPLSDLVNSATISLYDAVSLLEELRDACPEEVLDEEVEWEVPVCRVAYASRNIKVMAKSESEAIDKAIDEAGDFEFGSGEADYEAPDGALKI
jgi:hypothetical protein